MPYTINKFNGSQISVISDGTIDNTLDLKLIGKNYAGYGEVQNENFVFLLENFSNNTPPPRPITGQLWYDNVNSKLKFYDGVRFRASGGAEASAIRPTGVSLGDFWFDSTNKQLWAFDGIEFVLIGPQGVPNAGTTQMKSRSVNDTLNNPHAIIEAIVNGSTIAVFSPDDVFTLNSINPIEGFTNIHQGVTLAYTRDDSVNNIGKTTSNHRFWGTATNAERLDGYPASEFLRTSQAIFTSVVSFSDAGYTVGSSSPPVLKVFNESAETPIFRNQDNGTMKFQTTVSGITKTPLQLVNSDVRPGLDNDTDLGSASYKFKRVYAYEFIGPSTQSNSLLVGSEYKTASIESGAGTVVARTQVDESISGTNITAGAIKGTFFVGTATAANYADLAEKYLPDTEYEVGTVVVVGGDKEITESTYGQRAIGAISENPAYMMNAELEGGIYVALKGRVPVKVSGPINKGDRLVASYNGTAAQASVVDHNVFAIALESSSLHDVKLVECLIL